MNAIKYFLTFAGSALATLILCTPHNADAKRRVMPGSACEATSPSSLDYAFNCPLPTGHEFNGTTISSTEVDFHSVFTTTTKAQACRQDWDATTLTCSAYAEKTVSGVDELYCSAAPFSGGDESDFRYYHIEAAGGTKILGTYTVNSD